VLKQQLGLELYDVLNLTSLPHAYTPSQVQLISNLPHGYASAALIGRMATEMKQPDPLEARAGCKFAQGGLSGIRPVRKKLRERQAGPDSPVSLDCRVDFRKVAGDELFENPRAPIVLESRSSSRRSKPGAC
jgi:hypothetical protein